MTEGNIFSLFTLAGGGGTPVLPMGEGDTSQDGEIHAGRLSCCISFAPTNHSSFVTFQINMAVQTDHTQKRWVNLGNLSAACITIPETCGPEGAAMVFWVKMTGPKDRTLIVLTSRQQSLRSGFFLLMYPSGNFRTE